MTTILLFYATFIYSLMGLQDDGTITEHNTADNSDAVPLTLP